MTWNQVRDHVASLSRTSRAHCNGEEVDCDINPNDRVGVKWEIQEPHHPIHRAVEEGTLKSSSVGSIMELLLIFVVIVELLH